VKSSVGAFKNLVNARKCTKIRCPFKKCRLFVHITVNCCPVFGEKLSNRYRLLPIFLREYLVVKSNTTCKTVEKNTLPWS